MSTVAECTRALPALNGSASATESLGRAVRIECTTWTRDSHGLFDYEARQVAVRHFMTTEPARLYRTGSTVECLAEEANPPLPPEGPQGQQQATATDLLLSVRCREGRFTVFPADRSVCQNASPPLSPQKLWAIVRETPTNRHALQEGDVLKLGRYKMRVKQLVPGVPASTAAASGEAVVAEGGRAAEGNGPAATATQHTTAPASALGGGGFGGLFGSGIPASPPQQDQQDQQQSLPLPDLRIEEGELPVSVVAPECVLFGPSSFGEDDHALDEGPCAAPVAVLAEGESVALGVGASVLSDMQCRICLLEGNQENDPLISPCDCKGSIKFVHLECLRHWINGRLNLSEQQQRPVFVRQLLCELCKVPYPSAILYNKETIKIVTVPKTEPPFLVLENIAGAHQRGFYVISMSSNKYLKLGRGHESDVRIPDVSISRHHATIKFVEGAFFLEDHNSKFGTLVALRKPVPLGEHVTALQVGRSVVKLSVLASPLPGSFVTQLADLPASQPPRAAAPPGVGSAEEEAASHACSELNAAVLQDMMQNQLQSQQALSLLAAQGRQAAAAVSAARASHPSSLLIERIVQQNASHVAAEALIPSSQQFPQGRPEEASLGAAPTAATAARPFSPQHSAAYRRQLEQQHQFMLQQHQQLQQQMEMLHHDQRNRRLNNEPSAGADATAAPLAAHAQQQQPHHPHPPQQQPHQHHHPQRSLGLGAASASSSALGETALAAGASPASAQAATLQAPSAGAPPAGSSFRRTAAAPPPGSAPTAGASGGLPCSLRLMLQRRMAETAALPAWNAQQQTQASNSPQHPLFAPTLAAEASFGAAATNNSAAENVAGSAVGGVVFGSGVVGVGEGPVFAAASEQLARSLEPAVLAGAAAAMPASAPREAASSASAVALASGPSGISALLASRVMATSLQSAAAGVTAAVSAADPAMEVDAGASAAEAAAACQTGAASSRPVV